MELSKDWRGAVVFDKGSSVRFFRFFESDIALIPRSNEILNQRNRTAQSHGNEFQFIYSLDIQPVVLELFTRPT